MMPGFEIDQQGLTLLDMIKAYPEVVEKKLRGLRKESKKENLKYAMELITEYRNKYYGNSVDTPLKGLMDWVQCQINEVE